MNIWRYFQRKKKFDSLFTHCSKEFREPVHKETESY